jgi:hypothetical protein
LPFRGSACGRAQRAEQVGALAVLLPEVPAAELRRVCWGICPALLLGQGFLYATESQREVTSGGGACVGLEVDQDHLPVLADEAAI